MLNSNFTLSDLLNNALKTRYATKKFDSNKKISDQDLNTLLEVLRMTPSSFGIQPWKFLIIANQDLKERLKSNSYEQEQITTCSHLVVLSARKNLTNRDIEKYLEDIAKTRNLNKEDLQDFANSMYFSIQNKSDQELKNWNQKQVYIALGFLVMASALLGIDSCPMEGFDSQSYDEILNLQDYTATVLCALGYRSLDDEFSKYQKVRFSKNEVFEFLL